MKVPLIMSSLLQVSFAQQMIARDRVVGILVARYLTEHHLVSVGVQLRTDSAVGGAMDDMRCEDHLLTGGRRTDPPSAIYDKAKAEFVEVDNAFFRSYSNIGAMVLECTGMPPFARARNASSVSLFQSGTLINHAYSTAVHRDYYRHV